MFFLAMLRGMHRSIAEEFLLPSLSSLLSLHVCVSSEVFPPRFRGKKWVWSFSPGDYLTCVCYRVYIHNVYKHESSIYIIHIYLSIPYKCKFAMTRFVLLLSLSMLNYYRPHLSLSLFLISSREYNKGLRIM